MVILFFLPYVYPPFIFGNRRTHMESPSNYRRTYFVLVAFHYNTSIQIFLVNNSIQSFFRLNLNHIEYKNSSLFSITSKFKSHCHKYVIRDSELRTLFIDKNNSNFFISYNLSLKRQFFRFKNRPQNEIIYKSDAFLS